jgi:hypothetical protein
MARPDRFQLHAGQLAANGGIASTALTRLSPPKLSFQLTGGVDLAFSGLCSVVILRLDFYTPSNIRQLCAHMNTCALPCRSAFAGANVKQHARNGRVQLNKQVVAMATKKLNSYDEEWNKGRRQCLHATRLHPQPPVICERRRRHSKPPMSTSALCRYWLHWLFHGGS